jgi:hypothetical protein
MLRWHGKRSFSVSIFVRSARCAEQQGSIISQTRILMINSGPLLNALSAVGKACSATATLSPTRRYQLRNMARSFGPRPELVIPGVRPRSTIQACVRSADAGSAKRIPVSLRRCEAVCNAERADREGDACYLRRTRVPRAAIDRETVLWRTAANICRAWRLWVKGGRGRQVDGTAGLPPAPEIAVRSRTYASCHEPTSLQSSSDTCQAP